MLPAAYLSPSELQKRLDERTSRLTELEQEVEVMRGELSAAHDAARQAPSKTLRALVDKLRDQLGIKEKQHQVHACMYNVMDIYRQFKVLKRLNVCYVKYGVLLVNSRTLHLIDGLSSGRRIRCFFNFNFHRPSQRHFCRSEQTLWRLLRRLWRLCLVFVCVCVYVCVVSTRLLFGTL